MAMAMTDFEWPTAFYLAQLDHVINNPNILFRLVRPTPPTKLQKLGGVESAAGLVNVIPQRRIYRMETVEEIEIFRRELLKRPLVLQSISHSGFGCGSGALGCTFIPEERNWVLLVNQTHPKILGRLQMGVDAAKSAMNKGHPFMLRFRFENLLRRLHRDLISTDSRFPPNLQYADWEFAELVVRYPGEVGHSKRNPGKALLVPDCKELTFDFADIDLNEIKLVVNTSGLVQGPIPAITEDEIRDLLHGWTVNEITPLDEIGEERPDTYNYAQAGRLYESFRKKKRQRPNAKGEEAPPPQRPNSNTRPRRLQGRGPDDFDDIDIDEVETAFIDDGGFRDASRNTPVSATDPVRPQRKRDNYAQEMKADNLYPNVTIAGGQRDRSVSNDSRNYYNPTNKGPGVARPFHDGFHRNSDRSTDSAGASSATGADSGYSGDDGYGGYYGNRHPDYRDERYGDRPVDPMLDKYGNTSSQMAHENHGFHDEEPDDIMRKHQELVKRMMQQQGINNKSNNILDPAQLAYPGDRVHDHKSAPRSPRASQQNYHEQGRSRGYSDAPRGTERDYYDQTRPRGYSDYKDAPPSYSEISQPGGRSKFQIQQQEEAMSESFI